MYKNHIISYLSVSLIHTCKYFLVKHFRKEELLATIVLDLWLWASFQGKSFLLVLLDLKLIQTYYLVSFGFSFHTWLDYYLFVWENFNLFIAKNITFETNMRYLMPIFSSTSLFAVGGGQYSTSCWGT